MKKLSKKPSEARLKGMNAKSERVRAADIEGMPINFGTMNRLPCIHIASKHQTKAKAKKKKRKQRRK